ncbi:cytochrome C oxidase subunit IV [Robertkochia marina]|uniref:Cytochrome C oxidase subunit IV n=1 Tax=Robertkochia marina TaxID=1227945 RepID=A0A4S3M5T4_9FLAO|nr:cytochrome C oxidase subunit IV family protein [Robertkochia marina]THD69577.1 cytochrome C oxidase subunit IV [Robertkochia marina]TRZ47168.1 cytochrome C oxidase subunit IV [Robertkochia marina]
MAHAHESNTSRIWTVFIILSVVTIVEVALGIVKPEWSMVPVVGMKILNWIFIILTIVKAYYIAWAFMHLEGEKGSFRWSIVLPLVILIPYLAFILLVEGNYIHDVYSAGFVKWDF